MLKVLLELTAKFIVLVVVVRVLDRTASHVLISWRATNELDESRAHGKRKVL
jgi:hypothetical protein